MSHETSAPGVSSPLSRLRGDLEGVRHRLVHRSLSQILEKISRAWHLSFAPEYPRPDPSMWDILQRRVQALIEQDLQNVERGYYDASLLRSFGAADAIKVFPRLMQELPRMFLRKRRRQYVDLPPDADLARYPRYYQRNFHWQTDGWLSSRSAELYPIQVEYLFWGCADLMRRQLLPPLIDALKENARPRIADLACGAGEFLAQLRAALPGAQLYGVDLSPHYIAAAKRRLGAAHDVTLMAENAEELPLATGSFDAVTSIFLFHELPADARRNVMTEALRILKPGGRFVVCDSLQYCDEAGREISYYLEWFPATYHEPYYKGYVREPLEETLASCGFEVLRSDPNFLSKRVVARKPSAQA